MKKAIHQFFPIYFFFVICLAACTQVEPSPTRPPAGATPTADPVVTAAPLETDTPEPTPTTPVLSMVEGAAPTMEPEITPTERTRRPAHTFISWSHTDESGRCRQARIGQEWLEVRLCASTNATAYPLPPERQSELQQFLSTFAGFVADTNAGHVEFDGGNGFYAAPGEERLLATWAGLVVQEAESGQSPATVALEWQREQNGHCRQVRVTLTGVAVLFACDDDPAVELVQQPLTPEKLAQLYDWYDRLGAVTTESFAFYGAGGAALVETDKQAIKRFAASLFATMSLDVTAAAAVTLEPLAQAASIHFAGWAPDSRWLASWQSTHEDWEQNEDPTRPPSATLHFSNLETGESCAMPQFYGHPQANRLTWTADKRVIVQMETATFIGHPCQPDSFIPYDNEPVVETSADPNLSPNGRYRIVTEVLAKTENSTSLRTTMFDTASEQLLHTVEWVSYGYDNRRWITPSQYLIGETAQRPLLIDAEGDVLDIPLDIFGVRPLPANSAGDWLLYHALGLPADARDQFHLLLILRGNFNETFPAAMLYHAERNLVETLPAGWHIRNFGAVDEWLFLTEEVVRGEELHDVQRNMGYNIWARRLEEVDGEWQLVAPATDSVFWNEDQSQMAYIQDENTVVWQTFPAGEPLGRWRTDPYRALVAYFSPDGRYLAITGSVTGRPDYALFVHERE